ncbi:MAG TPA: hypothetical protein VLJ37_08730 [bacterium]|nr:hypothetical protein [bacterium]
MKKIALFFFLIPMALHAAEGGRKGRLDVGADLGIGVRSPARGIVQLHFGGFPANNIRLGVTGDFQIGDSPYEGIVGLSFGFGGLFHYYFDLSGSRIAPFVGAGLGWRHLIAEDYDLNELDATLTEAGVSIPIGAKGRFVYEPRASFHYIRGGGENSWDVRVFPASFSLRIL